MSLAARCPWCETVFRLTEGQASAQGGMARCGVCSHTFNALDALLSDSAVAALERGAEARKANQELTLKRAEPAVAAPSPVSIDAPPSVMPRLDSRAPVAAPQIAPSPPVGVAAKPAAAQPPSPTPTSAPSISSLRLPAFLMAKPKNPLPAPEPEPAPIEAPSTQAPRVSAPEHRSVSAAPTTMTAFASAPSPASSASPSAPPALLTKPSFVSMPLTPPPTPPRATEEPAPVENRFIEPAPSSTLARHDELDSAEKRNEPRQSAPLPTASMQYQVELPNYVAAPSEPLAETPSRATSVFGPAHAEEVEKIRAALLSAREAAIARTGNVDESRLQQQRVPEIEPEPEQEPELQLQPEAPSRLELEREQARLGPSTFQPSFLKSERASPAWRMVRRSLMLLALLVAALILAGQGIYWGRSELAVWMPDLKPYLVEACERTGCQVMPPAQIEQLSIESSELTAVPGTANTLGFTALIRNHSSNAEAFPAIEVTLTDARDQAVLRRDFLPASYLGSATNTRLLAGIPSNSEYTIKLVFDTSGTATAGYRAGIFYP